MSILRTAVVSDPGLLGTAPRDDSALSKLDRLGILVSSLCLLHCLALPLVVALLPMFAELLPPDIWVHVVLIGLALPLTGFTLLRGYLVRRDPRPVLLGASGLGLVACGLFASTAIFDAALTVAGGLLVAVAHILNMRGYGLLCRDEHHAHT